MTGLVQRTRKSGLSPTKDSMTGGDVGGGRGHNGKSESQRVTQPAKIAEKSRIEGRGSKIEDRGSRVEDQGS